MERELARGLRSKTRDNLFSALVEQYGEFDVPTPFVQVEIERLRRNMLNQMKMYGMKELPEQFKNDDMYRGEALVNARLGVILRTVAEKNDIKGASDESVEAELNLIAGAYEKPEEFKAEIKKDKRQFANIQELALERDVINTIMAKAVDGEEELTFEQIINYRAAQQY